MSVSHIMPTALAAVLVALLCAPASAALTTIAASDPLVAWSGRTLPVGGSVFFDWEGVAATVTLAPNVSLLTVTITDACGGTPAGGGSRWAVDMTADPAVSPAQHRVATFFSSAAVAQYVLFANPGARCDPRCDFAAPTTFTLTRLTESRLSGCTQAGNLSVAAFSADAAFLPPPPRPARLLEFCGDSITAGDLNAGFYASGTGSPAHCGNAAVNNDILLGYGAALCRNFSTDCMHTAWGGTTLEGMAPLYGSTFSSLGPGKSYGAWAFPRAADAVVVNLGTNGGDTQALYQAFATDIVRTYYRNASTALFLAYGPMTAGYEPLVRSVVANLSAAGLRAFALDLTLPHAMSGCFGHPSAADHAEIAAKAQPQIAQALGW